MEICIYLSIEWKYLVSNFQPLIHRKRMMSGFMDNTFSYVYLLVFNWVCILLQQQHQLVVLPCLVFSGKLMFWSVLWCTARSESVNFFCNSSSKWWVVVKILSGGDGCKRKYLQKSVVGEDLNKKWISSEKGIGAPRFARKVRAVAPLCQGLAIATRAQKVLQTKHIILTLKIVLS